MLTYYRALHHLSYQFGSLMSVTISVDHTDFMRLVVSVVKIRVKLKCKEM